MQSQDTEVKLEDITPKNLDQLNIKDLVKMDIDIESLQNCEKANENIFEYKQNRELNLSAWSLAKNMMANPDHYEKRKAANYLISISENMEGSEINFHKMRESGMSWGEAKKMFKYFSDVWIAYDNKGTSLPEYKKLISDHGSKVISSMKTLTNIEHLENIGYKITYDKLDPVECDLNAYKIIVPKLTKN